MKEQDNLLDILRKTVAAMKREDVIEMRRLSNRTIHSASIYYDTDNIAAAVMIYALSKLLEREKYQGYGSWNQFIEKCIMRLEEAIDAVEADDTEMFRHAVTGIKEEVNALSDHLKDYIEDVFRKASVNKASRIYEHGISMQQTAEMLGISVFELAEYAGRTGIADVGLSITKDVKERVKIAEEILS